MVVAYTSISLTARARCGELRLPRDNPGNVVSIFQVVFDSAESIRLLTELGLVNKDYLGNLHVLSLDASTRNLPISAQPIVVDRTYDFEPQEGFDRVAEEADGGEYRKEDTLRQKYGWF